MAHNVPVPTNIEYRRIPKVLFIEFENGEQFEMSAEFLRVNSPSAEVRGHSEDTAVLQVGKQDVQIDRIVPVGNYAVQLYFDDNHDTGIFSWDWLYYLGTNKNQLWAEYLEKLDKAGAKRSPSN
jgi:DUF971 family protein